MRIINRFFKFHYSVSKLNLSCLQSINENAISDPDKRAIEIKREIAIKEAHFKKMTLKKALLSSSTDSDQLLDSPKIISMHKKLNLLKNRTKS